MPQKISERNIFPNLNLIEEYTKIEFLFSEKKCIYGYSKYGLLSHVPQYTLEDFFRSNCFDSWFLRGSFISYEEMRIKLGISKEDMSKKHSKELFLDYLQFLLNCMNCISNNINHENKQLFNMNVFDKLLNFLIQITEHLNYIYEFNDEKDEIYLRENNKIVTTICQKHEDIKDKVVEYERHSLKGNLERKAEILCTLYKELESVEKIFNGTTYKNILDDTTFLFNKSGIRHNVSKDKTAIKIFEAMNKEELEKWYDTTYDLFLTCILITDYLKNKKNIEKLKI